MEIGIVGAGLGGLLAGAILSYNHKITIFEKLPFLGGRFTNLNYDGFQLTTGALHMIPHGSRGYLAKALKMAKADVKIVNSKPDGTFLINGREYLYKDLFDLLGVKDKIKALKKATNLKLGIVDYNQPFGEFLEDVDLALMIGKAFTGWALSLDVYEVTMKEIINIANNYYKFKGPGVPIGGCKAVIDELVKIIERNGGNIIKEYEVKKIEVEDKAYIDDREFDIVISNISPKETQKMCNIKFLDKKIEPSKGIKISIASKKGIIKHNGVLFTPECERINGLNQVTNVDKSLAPEGYHLIMTHQAQISNNVKKEIDLGLEDIDKLFKNIDYKILHIQSYRDDFPVNHAKNGHDVGNIINDRLYLVGDGAKGGDMEVEGIAIGVLKVVNHINQLNL
ncbi:hypothetical protein J422_06738 [Methanocaldococcus villosus KIN24-T80]|uniref:Uncharacterized protein n=1 Tax=Methanocaldococcus villosus KIN24-T80 TaxID=1069083 RepID=N6V026_9EURY|nr:NAD(P)-binding protein [Methanocaldococcus villosus]ENN95643.1 hypothetical protein J422_06738 [Methanocaldococcus villosus KIN24-T80]